MLHVTKHQDPAQLRATGHGRRDPGVFPAVRPKAQRFHDALQGQPRCVHPGGGRGGAGGPDAPRCARDERPASRSRRPNIESPRQGGASFSF